MTGREWPGRDADYSGRVARAEFLLRPATLEDAEGAGAMHYASFVEAYTGLADASFWARASRERSIEGWRRMLQDGLEATIAEIEGSTVGLAITGPAVARGDLPPSRERELTNLYVLERHQGLGTALLEAVLPPGTSAQLWVARGNPRAVRFYERHGFAADGATDEGSTFGEIAAQRMVR